jgi:hypothetical protein
MLNHVPLANELRKVLATTGANLAPNERYQAVIDLIAEMLVFDEREAAVEMAANGELSEGDTPDEVGVHTALQSLRDGDYCLIEDIDDAINRMYCAEDPAPTPVYQDEQLDRHDAIAICGCGDSHCDTCNPGHSF